MGSGAGEAVESTLANCGGCGGPVRLPNRWRKESAKAAGEVGKGAGQAAQEAGEGAEQAVRGWRGCRQGAKWPEIGGQGGWRCRGQVTGEVRAGGRGSAGQAEDSQGPGRRAKKVIGQPDKQ